jgi:hypothetical protein
MQIFYLTIFEFKNSIQHHLDFSEKYEVKFYTSEVVV